MSASLAMYSASELVDLIRQGKIGSLEVFLSRNARPRPLCGQARIHGPIARDR